MIKNQADYARQNNINLRELMANSVEKLAPLPCSELHFLNALAPPPPHLYPPFQAQPHAHMIGHNTLY